MIIYENNIYLENQRLPLNLEKNVIVDNILLIEFDFYFNKATSDIIFAMFWYCESENAIMC